MILLTINGIVWDNIIPYIILFVYNILTDKITVQNQIFKNLLRIFRWHLFISFSIAPFISWCFRPNHHSNIFQWIISPPAFPYDANGIMITWCLTIDPIQIRFNAAEIKMNRNSNKYHGLMNETARTLTCCTTIRRHTKPHTNNNPLVHLSMLDHSADQTC